MLVGLEEAVKEKSSKEKSRSRSPVEDRKATKEKDRSRPRSKDRSPSKKRSPSRKRSRDRKEKARKSPPGEIEEWDWKTLLTCISSVVEQRFKLISHTLLIVGTTSNASSVATVNLN